MSGERGSGSLLSLAIISAVVTAMLAVIPLYSVLAAAQQVAGAADAAALAAADVAIGRIPGFPCQVAASVAEANGARLTGCQPDGVIVTVRATASALGFSVTSSATAGPPGAVSR